MNDLIKQARDIIGSNKTEKAARDFMSNDQRDALAEDFASRKQFLSASHFHSNVEKRKEFERIFWENMKPKNN